MLLGPESLFEHADIRQSSGGALGRFLLPATMDLHFIYDDPYNTAVLTIDDSTLYTVKTDKFKEWTGRSPTQIKSATRSGIATLMLFSGFGAQKPAFVNVRGRDVTPQRPQNLLSS